MPATQDNGVREDLIIHSQYDFPKVELHCHLDGCFRVQTIIELAKKRGIPLPVYEEEELKKYITLSRPCISLYEYLRPFEIFEPTFAGCGDALARIAREAVEDKAKDGVKYIEFRYSPQLLANCDVTPIARVKERGRLRPKDVVEVISHALNEAAEEFQIKVKTILCDIVEYDGWGQQTAQLCREYSSAGVVGFDVAGSEGREEFASGAVEAFQYCKMNGIHRTAHAGEAGPAIRVKTAIEQLNAERIGHGYHTVDDEKIYALAKRLGTHFEVCPISSRLTNSVPSDWSLHPAKRFLADGVNFSLSTDNSGLHQTTLPDDYDIAVREWGFTTQDLKKLNLNAARSSFLDYGEREQLIAELENAYSKTTKIE